MIMRAKTLNDVVVFELEGHLDFETTRQLEDACYSVLEKNRSQRIIFNMEKLRFVGSSGINQFIAVLKEFNNLPEPPRLCRVSAEFSMMFKAIQSARNPFELFDDEDAALSSFSALPPSDSADWSLPLKKAKKKSDGKKSLKKPKMSRA